MRPTPAAPVTDTPAVPTREEFERLLIAATNATFDCGAFDETERRPFDASISAYEQVAAIAKERRAAVLAAWDALEATATEREARLKELERDNGF